MNLKSVVEVKPDVVSRQVQGEEVILDLLSGTYFGLNEVGTRIWSLLKTKSSLGKVVETITKEFDVSRESAESDTVALVQSLEKKKLITVN